MSEIPATGITPSRTLLLWLAALAVTWVSGIEPTWRKVFDVANRFEQINLQRHEADRKAIALQQLFDGDRAERVRLKRFEDDYPAGEPRDKARSTLLAELVTVQDQVRKGKGAVPLDSAHATDPAKPCASAVLKPNKSSPQGSNKAEREYASAIDHLRNFCNAEDKLRDDQVRLAAQRAILQANEDRHKDALEKGRTHATEVRTKSDINFELLGVKFTAEPLLASLLWNCFAFAWLVAARQEAFQAAAPTPLVPAPKPAQHVSDLRLLALLTLLAWAMQLRVAWLGLGITALTGEMTWKALVAIAICLLFLGSAALVTMILARHLLAAPSPARDRSARLVVITAVLLFIGVFAAVWWMPSHALRLSHSVMRALPPLGALPLLLLAFVWWYARLHAIAKPGSPGRRVFLGGSAGLAALFLAGAVWWRPHQALPPKHDYKVALRRPRRRQAVRKTIKLAAGFYRNAHSKKPIIVHYISDRGEFAAHDRLPRAMEPIPRPEYAWQGAFKIPVVGSDKRGKDAGEEIPEPAQQLGPWNLELYRVALAAASWSFEHAALLMLSEHAAGRKNVKRACELLLNGIHHDTRYKKNLNNSRKRSAPSYRLYDLAAGLAVRYNQAQVLEELKQIIQQDDYGLVFESRIKKWDDVNSAWYRRWRERRVPMRWQTNKLVSVF